MRLGILITAICLAVMMSVSPAGAALFTGTPSPSLSPTFGTLIDFDDQATGTVVGATDYLAYGVASIAELTGGTLARYAGTQSSPNYVGTGVDYELGGGWLSGLDAGWDADILIAFTEAVQIVGIGVADSRGDDYIAAYDSDMNLLESYLVTSGLNTYVGIERASSDIKYLQIIGDFVAIDDLQFYVPEPATLLLLGAGLLGIGVARRRFRS